MIQKLSAEQLKENYTNLLEVINTSFKGERRKKLLKLYEQFGERMVVAPASGNINYHNCFPGGYVDHVLRVIKCAQQLYDVWEQNGAKMKYTEEEVIFAALNHDLGKMGDLTGDYYVPNPSEWHRKNLGKEYEYNSEISYMRVADRSLFLLQEAGIGISVNEFLGIKLHDGLYIDDNKAYLFNYPGKELNSHLPILLHHADHLATLIEKDNTNNTPSQIQKSKPKISSKNKKDLFVNLVENSPSLSARQNNLFEELFKD